MHKPRVVFRADGNNEIGLGHIIRSLALVNALKNDFHCVFAIQKPTLEIQKMILENCDSLIALSKVDSYSEDLMEFCSKLQNKDIVVMDGYSFISRYQESLIVGNYKTVAIDDMAASHFLTDLVINHADNIEAKQYSKSPFTKLCLGLNYLLLRQPFIKASLNKRDIHEAENIFICYGGSDFHNLTKRALEACIEIDSIKGIHIVVGAAYIHIDELHQYVKKLEYSEKVSIKCNLSADLLVDEMLSCQLAIVPGSGILYEACCIGMGVLSGYYAENQINLLNGMANKNCVISIGDFRQISKSNFIKSIKEALSIDKIRSQVISQNGIFNGESPSNLLNEFKKLSFEQEVKCRSANEKDVDQYFIWANDNVVRSSAINTEKIDYQGHVNWFNKKLLNKNSVLYYFEKEGIGIGQVRFDMFQGIYEVDYSVDSLYRNKGFGLIILKLAIKELIKRKTNISITGRVKSSNFASQKVFENLNFSLFDKEQIKGELFYIYKLSI